MSDLKKTIKVLPFNDIADYIRGISYRKAMEIKGSNNGYKLLRANNISLRDNSLNFDDVKVIDFSVDVKENQFLKKEDILICAGSGSKEHIGKIAYIFQDINYTFGSFMGVIRANKKVINPRYLFHILASPIFKEHLTKITDTNSSTINNINKNTWRDFKVPIPPLEVQKEIANILDKFTESKDELTSLFNKELAKREKQYEYYREKLLTF